MSRFRLLPLALAAAVSGIAAVHAEPAEQAASADATPPGCFEVEINGERAPSFSCLTQKLQPSKPPAAPGALPQLGSDAIVQRPGNQLGLFNYAATQHRMGGNFGKSVLPQRPPPPAPPPPLPMRPPLTR